MIVGLIFLYIKNLFDIKIEIYYQIMGVITKTKCNNR